MINCSARGRGINFFFDPPKDQLAQQREMDALAGRMDGPVGAAFGSGVARCLYDKILAFFKALNMIGLSEPEDAGWLAGSVRAGKLFKPVIEYSLFSAFGSLDKVSVPVYTPSHATKSGRRVISSVGRAADS